MTDMMQSANAMIVLEDYGSRGGGSGNDSMLVNEHNPFHLDRLRRPVNSDFVTPPDRVRHDPLRVLMQQLQNDEQGFSPDSDIYNVIMSAAPGDVASILLGNDGSMGGEFNYTVTNTPGHGVRIGSIRPESQGDLSVSVSDLLPGGVDRALQYRGLGVHHPLLSLSDDTSAIGRPSRIAMLVHQSLPTTLSAAARFQAIGRAVNGEALSQGDTQQFLMNERMGEKFDSFSFIISFFS